MINLLLLLFCFLLGVALRRTGQLPGNAASSLNGFVVNISLPALILLQLRELDIDRALLMPVLMAWLVFGFACVFFGVTGHLLKLPRATIGGLILTGGLANTAFLGLPMIESFYGSEHLRLGILIDQLGSYFVLSTVGMWVAAVYSADRTVSLQTVIRKMCLFRPFQAFAVAMVLMPLEWPLWALDPLEKLAATLVPLALVSVGFQMQVGQAQGRSGFLALGLTFKLLIAPGLILLVYTTVFNMSGPHLQITVFESAMAPMIGASIVAQQHGLDPPLLNLMVGVGIPLSFVTSPAWWYVLQPFA